MELVVQAGSGNIAYSKFKKVVSYFKLVSRISPESLRKFAEDVLRLLQNSILAMMNIFST